MRSQISHSRFLVEDKHAHYIALIKSNHPTLHQRLESLAWREVPLGGKTRPPCLVRCGRQCRGLRVRCLSTTLPAGVRRGVAGRRQGDPGGRLRGVPLIRPR
ncbi:hypothetical protein OG528_35945 [Streptomyces platensis]|uniref:hypothetical protein n=1 Tax=Streptomyces platensis TaxID=58346 RepID=UPI0030E5B719